MAQQADCLARREMREHGQRWDGRQEILPRQLLWAGHRGNEFEGRGV